MQNETFKQELYEQQEQEEGKKRKEEGKGNKRGRPPPASAAKRTLQIRNAQKAYRERKEARMLQLESQVAELTSRLEAKASNNNVSNVVSGDAKSETSYVNLTQPANRSSCTNCPSCCQLLQLLRAANARSTDLEVQLADIQRMHQQQLIQLVNQHKPTMPIEPEQTSQVSQASVIPRNISPGMPVPLVESPLSRFGAPVGVELGNISLKALPSLRNSFHLIDEMREAQIESSDPSFIKKQVIKIEDLKYKILEAANLVDRYKAVEIFDYGHSLHRSFFEYSHSVSKAAISLSSSSSKSLSVTSPDVAASVTSSNSHTSRIDYSALPSDLITSQTQFRDAVRLIPSFTNDRATAIIQEMCDAYLVKYLADMLSELLVRTN
ncbi:hypothetical protein HK100_005747 [Physocladia obscura]|uniref:BZIP domain-containing protein n=1 Tax=Physocladia obscura TaxID=109957 RepID=A0AAD5SRB6_9FUNG|nr:hypothetical protein HK100_005747 [Physocladia obscura]